MGLSITIITDYDSKKTPMEQVDDAMAALGFVRKTSAVSLIMGDVEHIAREQAEAAIDKGEPKAELGPDTRGVMNVGLDRAEHADAEVSAGVAEVIMQGTAPARGPDPDYTHPSGRKFGQATGKRRTKAEMAEDDAYLASLEVKVDANEPLPESVYMDANGDLQAKRADQVEDDQIVALAPAEDDQIVALAPAEDDANPQVAFVAASAQVAFVAASEDAETAAQDAADEAAETASEQTGVLTLEDLRRAIGEYAKKHGMAKASANIPAIIEGPMLEVTDFERAIARVKLAAATSDGLLHEADVAPHATKDDLMEAVMAYAAKYEGKGVKPATGGPTAVDLAQVMRDTFPGTSGALSEIPATPEGYGKALGAVNAAINDNPFKREVK
jgi:hypothetical protein